MQPASSNVAASTAFCQPHLTRCRAQPPGKHRAPACTMPCGGTTTPTSVHQPHHLSGHATCITAGSNATVSTITHQPHHCAALNQHMPRASPSQHTATTATRVHQTPNCYQHATCIATSRNSALSTQYTSHMSAHASTNTCHMHRSGAVTTSTVVHRPHDSSVFHEHIPQACLPSWGRKLAQTTPQPCTYSYPISQPCPVMPCGRSCPATCPVNPTPCGKLTSFCICTVCIVHIPA
jgi:hypothetical protein